MAASSDSDPSAPTDSLFPQQESQKRETAAKQFADDLTQPAADRKALRERWEKAFASATDFPREEQQHGRKLSAESVQRWSERFVALGQIVRECDVAIPALHLADKLRSSYLAAIPTRLKFAVGILLFALERKNDEIASAVTVATIPGELLRFRHWLPYIRDRLWHPYPDQNGVILCAITPTNTSKADVRRAARAFRWPPLPERGANLTGPDESPDPLTEESGIQDFADGVDKEGLMDDILEPKSFEYSPNSELSRIVFELNKPRDESPKRPTGTRAIPNPFDIERRHWIPILRDAIDGIPELNGKLTVVKLRKWLWRYFEVEPTDEILIADLVKMFERACSEAGSIKKTSSPNPESEILKSPVSHSDFVMATPSPIAGPSTGVTPNCSEATAPTPAAVKTASILRNPPCAEAIAAYRTWRLIGMNQTALAEMLTKEFKRPISQGQVSRWLKQVAEWSEAGNVLPDPPAAEPKPMPIDPKHIDSGPRLDRRVARQRKRRNDDK